MELLQMNLDGRQKRTENKQGVQIDLILDRSDNCINIFELKYHNSTFNISKEYSDRLRTKIERFKEETKTKKNVFLTFLTAYGVSKNKYYLSLNANQLLLEALFQEKDSPCHK